MTDEYRLIDHVPACYLEVGDIVRETPNSEFVTLTEILDDGDQIILSAVDRFENFIDLPPVDPSDVVDIYAEVDEDVMI